MTLHFKKLGEPTEKSPIVFIHGLFGSGANWVPVANKFSQDRLSYTLDLRNHGKSPHLPSHTYLDMASDIQEFAISEGLDDYILCGHSMGGKAVMTNALMGGGLEMDNRMKAIVILDIAPVAYTHSYASVMKGVLSLDIENLKSRADADKQLQEAIPDNAVRLFLLHSLAREEGKFVWRLNLEVLDEYISSVVGFPSHLMDDKQFNKPALFIYGGDSDFVMPESHEKIKQLFPQSSIERLDGAGHWVHIDKKLEMIDSINQFIDKNPT